MSDTILEQGLTPWQTEQLAASLDHTNVKQRKQGGRQLSYVEGHYVIREMNRIFGPAGWERHTTKMKCVHDEPYESSDKKKTGRLVGYVAQVEVTVRLGADEKGFQDYWTSDGWGYGEGIDYNNPAQAHEAAVKEAETDAMKRACILLGDPFGLELYGGDGRRVKPAAQGERINVMGVPVEEPSWADGGKDVDFDAPKTLGKSGWAALRQQYKKICDELGVDYQDEQVKGALRNYKKVQDVTRMEDLPRDCAGGILSAVKEAAKLVRGGEFEKARAELKRLGGFAEGLDTVAEVQAEIAKIKEATDED